MLRSELVSVLQWECVEIAVGAPVGTGVSVGVGSDWAGCRAIIWAIIASVESPLTVVKAKSPVAPAATWVWAPAVLLR